MSTEVKKRKICVVTGSRADYGFLRWIIGAIGDDPQLRLQVAVTGMHLSKEFGLTYREIEKDGFSIDARIPVLSGDNSPEGVAESMARGLSGFAAAWKALRPDLVVVLGDRYEIFAAAQAAMIARIPLAHISGGEATEGLTDEAIRHSITKMAQFHFVYAEAYRRRVIQLGEQPKNVFNYGSPGMDMISKLKLLPKAELEQRLKFKFGKKTFLVTYHPTTLSDEPAARPLNRLFCALDGFKDAKLIFTKSNSDAGGAEVNRLLEAYVRRHKNRAAVFTSLGQLKYFSVMKYADAVIGNSSSGIVEAPVFKKLTVNIGDRQRGRLRASSIIDCSDSSAAITRAIQKGLSPRFQKSLSKVRLEYRFDKNISLKIKNRLKKVSLDGVLMKKFYNL